MISIRRVNEHLVKKLKPLLLLPMLAALPVMAAGAAVTDGLQRQFQTPPLQAQPWVYWVWLDSDIPRPAITRDLEEMKAKGIAGCILYGNQSGRWTWRGDAVLADKDYQVAKNNAYKNSYITTMPGDPLVTWSPHWRELARFAARECGRLGLEFVVCDGLANTSGPIPEEYGEQKLVWTATPVHGLQTYDGTWPESQLVEPRGVHYRRNVAVFAVPDRPDYSTGEAVNLTDKIDAAGRLHWMVPEGDWKIIYFVQVPTGARNVWGLYTDSLSAEALDQTWAVTMAPLLKEMTPEERRGIKGIEDDSWEAGKTTWTQRFPEAFKQRRGYDLIPWLPVIAGVPMGDAATRGRVLRDYALTISDLIADNHYDHLNQLAAANGLVCHSEAAGPNYDQADVLKTSSRVADAMAEFWMPSEHRPTMNSRFLLRNAANANHIYGKPVTMCEAFTSLGPEWEETPLSMKPVADQAFCDGLNRICFHNFGQSPSLTARPGYVYCAGTQYNPGITWWDESPAFNTYLARCSALLQAGKFVADAIIYHGDNVGKGEPRKQTLPALGEGYDHDNCNSEVLLTRMSVRDGRILLPDGMSYRVLVLPDNTPMPFADLEKMADLIAAGATVVGPPPAGLAGLPLQPGDEEKFNALAARLWKGLDGTNATAKTIGAGRLIWGQTARQALLAAGVPPDFEASGVSDTGTIDWIHRTAGDAEVYYVASRWEHPEKIDATFRVSGKQPELWNPLTGEMREATAFRQANGCTVVPLELASWGSTFVVFQKPIAVTQSGPAPSNYPATELLTTLAGPWTVNFDPKWGGPESVVFDTLTDWTNRPEPGIKYYSGTAVYHKQFSINTLPAKSQRLLLDLGEVDDIASVRLNGRDLGVLWTKPAKVDITDEIKAGNNDLAVTVVNLWPNRLSRDESLPKEQRLTETNIHKFGPASPLLSSGLVGPVNLLLSDDLPPVTHGSSCVATRGFEAESRWDSGSGPAKRPPENKGGLSRSQTGAPDAHRLRPPGAKW